MNNRQTPNSKCSAAIIVIWVLMKKKKKKKRNRVTHIEDSTLLRGEKVFEIIQVEQSPALRVPNDRCIVVSKTIPATTRVEQLTASYSASSNLPHNQAYVYFRHTLSPTPATTAIHIDAYLLCEGPFQPTIDPAQR